jgi:hypothetical protein
MWEMLEGMVKTFVNNLVAMNTLEIVLVTLWLSITGYASWYFISAKHHVPLTRKEAEILWKIHKNEAQCKAQKLHPIKRRDKIVGFKCDCGYKYMKKRPMLANTPVDRDDIRSRTSTFDEMHTTYESTTR